MSKLLKGDRREVDAMFKKLIHILICCMLSLGCLALAGCGVQHEPVDESEKKPGVAETSSESPSNESAPHKRYYEVDGGEDAEFLSYNYQSRSMYIAGLKVFQEFGTSNEGSVSIDTDEKALTFGMTKSTGTVTGAVDGPHVYFKMDLAADRIIEKKFEPAPNYAELGKTEFIEHSQEVIELTDERMIEIGKYFEEMIREIESN